MGEDESDWTPVFPGQREPFREGHELSLHHGAYSDRGLAPLAEEIERRWRSAPEWPAYLAQSVWDEPVTLATWRAARCHRLRAYVNERPVEEWVTDRHQETEETTQVSEGKTRRRTSGQRTRSAMDLLDRQEKGLLEALSALGLTPTSAARLGRNVVVAEAIRDGSLDAIRDVGRRSVAGRAEGFHVLPQDSDDGTGEAS